MVAGGVAPAVAAMAAMATREDSTERTVAAAIAVASAKAAEAAAAAVAAHATATPAAVAAAEEGVRRAGEGQDGHNQSDTIKHFLNLHLRTQMSASDVRLVAEPQITGRDLKKIGRVPHTANSEQTLNGRAD